MKIELPNIETQKKLIFEQSTKEAIQTLEENLSAPQYQTQTEIDETNYPNTHLLREREGWEAPHPDIIGAYFRNFQSTFEEFKTDKKLADLLGLSSDRRIREFKQGKRKVPYNVWRLFLVITGRAPQDIIKIKGYFG